MGISAIEVSSYLYHMKEENAIIAETLWFGHK
jgi:hypothetical protein